MSAPAHEKSAEGAPEWMVSYADMITIMMSFFVIMFALSQGRNEQEEAIESIGHRFGAEWNPWPQSSKATKEGSVAPPVASKHDASGPKAGRANIPTRGRQGGLGGSVYFGELSAELGPEQLMRLRRIAAECAGKPQKVEILGHTSNRPLPKDGALRDHWDLAYARSHCVMQHLVELGIPADRIRIGVAGDTEPANPRDAAAASELNSRVDVYLLSIFVTDFSPMFDQR